MAGLSPNAGAESATSLSSFDGASRAMRAGRSLQSARGFGGSEIDM
jgi:hypothetical protein